MNDITLSGLAGLLTEKRAQQAYQNTLVKSRQVDEIASEHFGVSNSRMPQNFPRETLLKEGFTSLAEINRVTKD